MPNQYPRVADAIGEPFSQIPLLPVKAKIAPPNNATATKWPIGQIWINTLSNTAYILVSYVGGIPTWVPIAAGGSGGALTTVALQTNDANPHAILTLPVANNTSFTFFGTLDGSDAAFANQLSGLIIAGVIRGAGAAAFTGNPNVNRAITNGAANTVDANVAIVANAFQVQVTGAAATIWNWKLTYYIVSLP